MDVLEYKGYVTKVHYDAAGAVWQGAGDCGCGEL